MATEGQEHPISVYLKIWILQPNQLNSSHLQFFFFDNFIEGKSDPIEPLSKVFFAVS